MKIGKALIRGMWHAVCFDGLRTVERDWSISDAASRLLQWNPSRRRKVNTHIMAGSNMKD